MTITLAENFLKPFSMVQVGSVMYGCGPISVAPMSYLGICIYKSTNPSVSGWTEVGRWLPTNSVPTQYLASSLTDYTGIKEVASGKLGVAISILQGTTTASVHYNEFDTSDDTWDYPGDSDWSAETLLSAVDPNITSVWMRTQLDARSDGDVLVSYNGEGERVMGTYYPRVVYSRREGSTWTKNVAVSPLGGSVGDAMPLPSFGTRVDPNDTAWFAYGRFVASITTSYRKELTSANSLSAEYTNNGIASFSQPIFFTYTGSLSEGWQIDTHVVGGTVNVVASRASGVIGATGAVSFTSAVLASYATNGAATVCNEMVLGRGHQVVQDGGSAQVVYVAWNASSDDLYLRTRASGNTWNATVTVRDAVSNSIGLLSAGEYEDAYSNVFGILSAKYSVGTTYTQVFEAWVLIPGQQWGEVAVPLAITGEGELGHVVAYDTFVAEGADPFPLFYHRADIAGQTWFPVGQNFGNYGAYISGDRVYPNAGSFGGIAMLCGVETASGRCVVQYRTWQSDTLGAKAGMIIGADAELCDYRLPSLTNNGQIPYVIGGGGHAYQVRFSRGAVSNQWTLSQMIESSLADAYFDWQEISTYQGINPADYPGGTLHVEVFGSSFRASFEGETLFNYTVSAGKTCFGLHGPVLSYASTDYIDDFRMWSLTDAADTAIGGRAHIYLTPRRGNSAVDSGYPEAFRPAAPRMEGFGLIFLPSGDSIGGAQLFTFDAVSITGTGSVGGGSGITGTGSLAVTAAMSGSGTHQQNVTGSGALEVTALAMSGSATVISPVTATGSMAATALAMSGAGTQTQSGTGTMAVTVPAMSGTGTQVTTGTGTLAVPQPLLAATGTQTQTASGTLAVAVPVLAATGAQAQNATGSMAVGAPTLTATGTTQANVTASGSLAVVASISGAGTQVFTGTATLAVPSPAMAGTGSAAAGVSGSGTLAVAVPTLAATGTHQQNVTATGTLAVVATLAGAGAQAQSATGSMAVVAALSATGTTQQNVTASGVLTVASPTLAAEGVWTPAGVTASGALAITTPTLSAIGAQAQSASGSMAVPSLAMAGVGYRLFVFDRFTVTVDTTLASHSPDIGGAWTVVNSSATVKAATDRVEGDSPSSSAIYYNARSPISRDGFAECLCGALVDDATSFMGPFWRWQPGAGGVGDLYQVYWNGSGINGWRLEAFKDGVGAFIGSYNGDNPFDAPRVVRLEVIGDAVKVYIDGTLRISATDSSIPLAGYAAFKTRSNGWVDDFVAVAYADYGSEIGGAGLAATLAMAGSGTVSAAGIDGSGTLAVPVPVLVAVGAQTQSATGSMAVVATVSGTGTQAQSATGTMAVTATLAATGATQQNVTASGALAVAPPTLAAAGAQGYVGSGALAVTATLAAIGTQAQSASGALAVDASIVGSGTQAQSGTGALAVTASMAGTGGIAGAVFGTGTMAVPVPTLAGTAAQAQSASGVMAVPVPALSGSGSTASAITGTGTLSVTAAMGGTLAQAQSASGALAITLGMVGTAGQVQSASGALAITAPTLAALAYQTHTASGIVTVAPPSLAAVATMRKVTMTGTLMPWTVETNIKDTGGTLVLTLTGDTWIP